MADEWRDWIGRTEVAEDRLDTGLAARFAAMLDVSEADPAPQGIHWCLAPPAVPSSGLGSDGHPLRGPGTLLPPVALPRRMWASSAVEFVRPLRPGDAIRRISRVDSIATKTGASGALTFVEVAHEIEARGSVAVRETQTIVYREAGAQTPPRPGPSGGFDAAGALAHRAVRPDTRLLFRYSALTFNAHRIHYDLPYAREVEGYPGLVVHGPLIATLLLDLARGALGDQPFATFAWRGVSPAIADEPLHLALWHERDGYRLGAFAEDGREITRASASARR